MKSKIFDVRYESRFEKDLENIDQKHARLILLWIKKNLVNTSNPRLQGKALQGKFKGLWRYRVGNYRLIAEIKDERLIILCIAVGHRKNIYRK